MTSPPLEPRLVAALLDSAMVTLRAELAALPEPLLAFHPAPGEWCVKEVVGHLIEAERRGFAGRVRIVLANDTPELESWDQDDVARARRDCERDARELVEELARMRKDSATLVSALGTADLARVGRHPKVGRLRVGDLLHEWVHHDRNHIKQILANVQAYAWPHMGNAQRFSDD
jgi:DinB family protein